MTRAEKTALIEELTDKFSNSKYFYITDFSTLTVEQSNDLRRACFNKNIEMKVVKNTLIRKALERVSETAYVDLYGTLKGPSAVLFSEDGKTPAVLIKEFRKGGKTKPELKSAYIDSGIFIGDDQIEALTKIKSKDELIADVIALLQSPMTTVMGQLNSGKNTIFGLLKAMGGDEEAEA